MIATLLGVALDTQAAIPGAAFSPGEAMLRNLAAVSVLAVLWLYHRRVLAEDEMRAPVTGRVATLRRLYVFGFSAAGLFLTTLGGIQLLRWFMFQLGGGPAIGRPGVAPLAREVARLSVGLLLWVPFWVRAQRLFTGPSAEERASVLRKLYLYLTVFIAALIAVTNVTIILAGFFRRLLDLPVQGDIRELLPTAIGTSVLWAYHTSVLQTDADVAGEAPRQADVRRLYHYLIAAIGLAAFLVGLSGDVSVLIRSLAPRVDFDPALREQLAWFTAALIVGLPVWSVPWRRVQIKAVAPGSAGVGERRSLVRTIYLYFYLFVATMTVLASMVYIVFRLLNVVLGEAGTENLFTDLAQPIAFSLIAAGVWLYHGFVLRQDGRLTQHERVARLQKLRVTVVDVGAGQFGRVVRDELRRESPGLPIETIVLTPEGEATDSESVPARLSAAGLIIAPWEVTVAGGAGGVVTPEIAEAVVKSQARKVLVPTCQEGWEWAGVERWSAEELVDQTVHAVMQIAEGEEVEPERPLSAGAMIALAVGGIVLLILFLIPADSIPDSCGRLLHALLSPVVQSICNHYP